MNIFRMNTSIVIGVLSLMLMIATGAHASTNKPLLVTTNAVDTDIDAARFLAKNETGGNHTDDSHDDHDDHEDDCHCDGEVAHCADSADEAAYTNATCAHDDHDSHDDHAEDHASHDDAGATSAGYGVFATAAVTTFVASVAIGMVL